MIRVIPVLVLAGVLLVAAPAARGQANRAAPAKPAAKSTDAPHPAWAKAVDAFARALVKGDQGAAFAMLAPRAAVRSVDKTANVEAWQLFEGVMNAALVGRHGYAHPPRAMAGDLAEDFRVATAVPVAAKGRFMLDDDAETRRANATAAQWLEAQLEAKPGTPVGVIVLWKARTGGAGAQGDANEAIFVLLRGEEAPAGQFKIRTAIFGTPVAEGHP